VIRDIAKWYGAHYDQEVRFRSAVKCKKGPQVPTSSLIQRRNYNQNDDLNCLQQHADYDRHVSMVERSNLYSVRGLERSELCGYHGCPGRKIKIGAKGALGSHEIRPIHSAPSLGQSITILTFYFTGKKSTW